LSLRRPGANAGIVAIVLDSINSRLGAAFFGFCFQRFFGKVVKTQVKRGDHVVYTGLKG